VASAKGIDLGERGLGVEPLRPNNISDWLNRRECRMAVRCEQHGAGECDHVIFLPFPHFGGGSKVAPRQNPAQEG
jgi:hypothetical protein